MYSIDSPNSSNAEWVTSSPVDYESVFMNRRQIRENLTVFEVGVVAVLVSIIGLVVLAVAFVMGSLPLGTGASLSVLLVLAGGSGVLALFRSSSRTFRIRGALLDELWQVQDDLKLDGSFMLAAINHLEKSNETGFYRNVVLKLKDNSEAKLAFSLDEYTFTVSR